MGSAIDTTEGKSPGSPGSPGSGAGNYTLLALGDSYTIGEGVPLYESFPYQTVQLLRRSGHAFFAPEIVARTGWTTAELANGIVQTPLLPSYDFVTLLIGVNNEYRGRSLPEFEKEFEALLKQAIQAAGGRARHVLVLSIPDWSVTPFAGTHLPDSKGRDKAAIAREIDAFNASARTIAGKYVVDFIDITEHTRGSSWLAADLLHPSGQEYGYWAEQCAERISERI